MITNILKTLLSGQTVQQLNAECATNAIGVLGQSLVATDQKICDITLGQRFESSTISFVQDLEGVMRAVARKIASTLVDGQSRELEVENSVIISSRHIVVKKARNLLFRPRAMLIRRYQLQPVKPKA